MRLLLSGDNASLIAYLLLIQDIDLSREVIAFIQTHFSQSHYLYSFKDTGIIEFLILYLDTELAQEAL